VVAAEREEKWGPRYVGNELAGTRQAADTQRRAATMRNAEADATPDPAEHERLRVQAEQARALAQTLDQQTEQLQYVDEARSRWLVDTARGRVEGAQSRAELARRHADDPTPPERVTAEEWLAAHGDATIDDDERRPITDTDLHDTADAATVDDHQQAIPDEVLDGPQPDIRELAAAEPDHTDSDRVRVSTPDEAAAWTDGARRALTELTVRQITDAQHEEEERAAQLARWHNDTSHDQHGETDQNGDDADTGPGDVLDYEPEPASV